MFRKSCFYGFLMLILVSVSACSSEPLSNNIDEQTPEFKDTQSSINEIDSISDAVNNDFKFLRVSHHKLECEGFFVSLCYRVQEKGSNVWRYLYEDIEGFDYQWGNTYEIRVSQESLQSGLADAPQTKYVLQQVLSTTPHDSAEPFTSISRKPHEYIKETEPGTFRHLGMMDFTCEPQACAALRSAIDQKQSVTLSFRHNDQPNAPLLLTAVLCADAPSAFMASCG